MDTVKVKVKKSSSLGRLSKANMMEQTKVIFHTFNRREYMRWWSSEFHTYRDAVGDGLAKGRAMRSLLLDAVLNDFEGKTDDRPAGDAADAGGGGSAGREGDAEEGGGFRLDTEC